MAEDSCGRSKQVVKASFHPLSFCSFAGLLALRYEKLKAFHHHQNSASVYQD